MNNPKYIIIQQTGLEKAIILNNNTSHDSLGLHRYDIISAGFFSWSIGEDKCKNPIIKSKAFGKSISLGKVSRPEEDSILIDKILNYWEI